MSYPYNPQPYSSGGGPPQTPPPAQKNSFKKGLGFINSTQAPYIHDAIKELVNTTPRFSRISSSLKGSISKTATIPLVDLDNLSNTSGEARRVLVKSFGDALRHEGFVAIQASQLNSLIEQGYQEMKSYFLRPFEQKLFDWQANEGIQGYFQQGSECARESKYPDIKESYYIPPNFSQWPKSSASFSQTFSKYHAYMHEYAKSLLKILYEYLGQPHADVDHSFSQNTNILRLTRYLTLKPTDHPEALWAAPHKDSNAITLMVPGTIPGLEKLESNGQWKPIVVPKGYLIVGSGLLLEHKTAGLIKARIHRVINPGGKYTLAERYVATFFGNWKQTFSLAPFASCLEIVTHGMSPKRKTSFLKQYPEITVEEKIF